MIRRQRTEEKDYVESIVKRVNSLIKLPRLGDRQNSLNSASPNHTKRTTVSPQKSNRTNYWKQKLLLAKKLTPLINYQHDEQQPKSSLINKMIPNPLRQTQVQERVLSSKLFGGNSQLVGIKNSLSTRNVEFNKIPTENEFKQGEKINEQKIVKVRQKFKQLLTQEAYNKLMFPNFQQINVQKFYPIWEMTDTILFMYQNIDRKSDVIKEIVTSYSYLTNQINQIRKFILSDIEKLGKPQLNEIIIKAFLIEIQFVYLILAQIIWKEAIGLFQQFLRNKIQLILKVRKQLFKIYLCDFTTKEEIKVNKRIVGFISFKQKYINELQKHIETFNNDFNTLSSQFTDSKFNVFKCFNTLTLEDVILFERKLKNKIFEVPTSPYLKTENLLEQRYNLIIEPEGFLFKQEKQTSIFLLRQGSLNFIKSMSEHCNIIFFSKLSAKTLNQYISYLEQKLGLKFNDVLDKKYMTYKNLKLQKNLQNLGLRDIHSKTIIIDPNYKHYINKEFWKICFPIDKEETHWEDSSFIDKLSEKLVQKICSNQMTLHSTL